jgi:hypothetical protein
LKDTDDDGVGDQAEALLGTYCNNVDTDNDGVADGDDQAINPASVQTVAALEDQVQFAADEAYQLAATEQPIDYPLLTSEAVRLTDTQVKTVKTLLTDELKLTNFQIVPGSNATVQTGNVTVVSVKQEFDFSDLLRSDKAANDGATIIMSGRVNVPRSSNLPYSLADQPRYVIITFFSAPAVKIAQVDTNGSWTMTVPAELLAAGEHTAYAVAEVDGQRGEEVEIAKFVIEEKTSLSNTTWLVIVNVIIAVGAVVISLVLQVRHKKQKSTPAI